MAQPDISTMTPAQQVRYAILCAQQLPQPEKWSRWAQRWLSGEDRSLSAADAAALVAAGRRAEAHTAVRAAVWVAQAAWVVGAQLTVAALAAKAVAWSARVAELSGAPLDLAALAQRAAEEEKQ